MISCRLRSLLHVNVCDLLSGQFVSVYSVNLQRDLVLASVQMITTPTPR